MRICIKPQHMCTQQFSPINNNHLEQSSIRERKRDGYRCRSSVAEHWQLKPEALGLIPGDTTFLSVTLPFQRSSDSNSLNHLSLDDLYQSLGFLCCHDTQTLSRSQHAHSNYHLSTPDIDKRSWCQPSCRMSCKIYCIMLVL